jgi:uncharacterized protein YbjT (DUF2867 family)
VIIVHFALRVVRQLAADGGEKHAVRRNAPPFAAMFRTTRAYLRDRKIVVIIEN